MVKESSIPIDGLRIGIILAIVGIILVIVIAPYLGMITMGCIKNQRRLKTREEETEKGILTYQWRSTFYVIIMLYMLYYNIIVFL